MSRAVKILYMFCIVLSLLSLYLKLKVAEKIILEYREIYINGVWSGHASHALRDQIFRNCMRNFCALRYRFFNLMRNGTDLG